MQTKTDDKRLKDAATAETNILQPPLDALKHPLSAEAMAPWADVYNANNSTSDVYIPHTVHNKLFPNTFKIEKYSIPPINGKTFSARDIYELAKSPKYRMSVKDFLEQEVYTKALKQRAPWLPAQ